MHKRLKFGLTLGGFILVCALGWGCSIGAQKSLLPSGHYVSTVTIDGMEEHSQGYASYFAVRVMSDDGTYWVIPMVSNAAVSMAEKARPPIQEVATSNTTFIIGGSFMPVFDLPRHGELKYWLCGKWTYCFDSFKETPR